MAAELEERVVDSDPLDPQNLAEDPDQHRFYRRCGLDEGRLELRPGAVGVRQAAAIDLAVGRQRQRIQTHDCRRHHVAGQALAQILAKDGLQAPAHVALLRVIRERTERLVRTRAALPLESDGRLHGRQAQEDVEAIGRAWARPSHAGVVAELFRERPNRLGVYAIDLLPSARATLPRSGVPHLLAPTRPRPGRL